MADEILILDATASNPDGTDPGTPLSIGPGTSYPLVEASFPAPPLNVLYSSSIDTEGENPVTGRHGNRTITLKIGVDEASAVNTLLDALALKFAKLQREGGTLKRTRKDGTVRIYDIVAGDGWEHAYDDQYLLQHSTDVPVSFPAKPYARGAEVDLGDNVETTLPALVFTDTGVTGDVPALGRLVVDNDDATNDQWWMVWGLESRNYSSSANAALFYEAEGRTAMGGSATAAGPSGASGAGSNVMRNTALATTYQAILSTQATGAGAHLSHVGTFRVFARVQIPTANTGNISVALEWAEGDFRRFTQNPAPTPPSSWEGSWRVLSLGFVTLSKVSAGTQRWEGRIVAKSTIAGDGIDVDWLMLVPVDEGYGEARAVTRFTTSTAFSARDEFDQTAGALTGKTLPIGGTWAGAGDADDFTVETTGKTAQRSLSTDAPDIGRYVTASTPTLTATAVQVDFTHATRETAWVRSGVVARFTDANNWLMAYLESSSSYAAATALLTVRQRVTGTITLLHQVSVPFATGIWYSLRLVVDVAGRLYVWFFPQSGGAGAPIIADQASVLATGGALASGKVGIYDEQFVL